MPGRPSKFEKTIIIVSGKSNSGKTTLSSYINKNMKHTGIIHLDRFFVNSNLKHFSKIIKYDKPYEHISSITKVLLSSDKYVRKFINDITEYIIGICKNEFRNNKKIILIEGYTLSFDKMNDHLTKCINNIYSDVHIWNITNKLF